MQVEHGVVQVEHGMVQVGRPVGDPVFEQTLNNPTKVVDVHYKALCAFLSNTELRTRYQAVCFKGPEVKERLHLFDSWSASHVMWRWEFLEDFVKKLLRVLPVMIDTFDRDTMQAGATKMHTQVIDNVAEALSYKPLVLVSHILSDTCAALGRQARWCEGCACHEHLLHKKDKNGRSRLAEYARESSGCPWKGCRAPEIVVRLDSILNVAMDPSSKACRQAFIVADVECRAAALKLDTSLRVTLSECLRNLLGYWRHLPYSLVGVYAHIVGACSLETSQAIARTCLQEADGAISKGLIHTLHRVARRILCDRASPFRQQLVMFASGEAALVSLPELYVELRAYSMIPVVSRRVEGVHAFIKRCGKKATRMSPALSSALLRRPQVLAQLRRRDFYNFVLAKARSRNLLRDLVACVEPTRGKMVLGTWSAKRLVARLHLCDAASQFRDLPSSRLGEKTFRQSVIASVVGTTEVQALVRSMVFCIKDMFDSMPMGETFWSLPTEALLRAVGPSAQIFDDDALLDCLEKAAAMPPAESDVVGLEFFAVVSTRPELKQIVRPSHIPSSATQVAITIMKATSTKPLRLPTRFATTMLLDLASVVAGGWFGELKAWPIRMATPRLMLVGSQAAAFDSFRDTSMMAIVAADTTDATVAQALEKLVEAGAVQGSGVMVSCEEINWEVSPALLESLVASGVVARSTNDFGEHTFCLTYSGLDATSSFRVGEPTRIAHLTLGREQFTTMSKSALVLQLLVRGWVPRPLCGAPHRAGSDLFFSWPMFKKSKRYFESLLLSEDILRKGAPHILDDQVDGYYQVLLSLENLGRFHSLACFSQLKNSHFLEIVRHGSLDIVESFQFAASLLDAPLLNLEDETTIQALDQELLGFLEDLPNDSGVMAVDRGLGAETVVVGPSIPTVGTTIVGGVVVHFDNFSHKNKRQRLWVRCRAPGHHACFKYRQLQQFEFDEEMATAWIVEWLLQGQTLPSKEDHGAFSPEQESVMRRLQAS